MSELWRLIDPDRDLEGLFRLPRLFMEGKEFPFRPSVDIVREAGQLIVTTELPGINPEEDVEITLDADSLTISGEKSEETELTKSDRVIRERRYGSFTRRIPVPEGVSADKVTAAYSDGVLKVTVTLPEESQPMEPRKIPVSSDKS
jgi:HSP20 family protein